MSDRGSLNSGKSLFVFFVSDESSYPIFYFLANGGLALTWNQSISSAVLSASVLKFLGVTFFSGVLASSGSCL